MIQMKIALGTTNEAKMRAVESFLKSEGFEEYDLEGMSVESGVDDMPFSDMECIEGAINRAKNALSASEDAEYGIGLEGGVTIIDGKMFLVGWVAITKKNGRTGVGSSGHIEVPNFIRKELEDGKELGPLMADLHNKDVRNLEGAMGIFSDGRISRSESFVGALKRAYSSLDNDIYNS